MTLPTQNKDEIGRMKKIIDKSKPFEREITDEELTKLILFGNKCFEAGQKSVYSLSHKAIWHEGFEAGKSAQFKEDFLFLISLEQTIKALDPTELDTAIQIPMKLIRSKIEELQQSLSKDDTDNYLPSVHGGTEPEVNSKIYSEFNCTSGSDNHSQENIMQVDQLDMTSTPYTKDKSPDTSNLCENCGKKLEEHFGRFLPYCSDDSFDNDTFEPREVWDKEFRPVSKSDKCSNFVEETGSICGEVFNENGDRAYCIEHRMKKSKLSEAGK